MNTPLKRINPASPKADEPLTILSYETVTRQEPNHQHVYLDGRNRPGNDLRLHVLLPKSTADTLMSLVEADPAAIRQAVDMLMTEQVGAGQGWEKAKPPYEQWHEADGGVSRMAIRTGLDQPLAQSTLVQM